MISMLLLFLQASSTAGELSQHPFLVLVLVSALLGAVVALMKLFLSLLEKRINEKFEFVDKHNDAQDKRLTSIEAQIARYETHVAVGERESSEIHAAIARVEILVADHIRKEETTTWAKIDKIGDQLTGLKLDNEMAHSALVSTQTMLGVRMSSVKKKMPNGDLSRLTKAFEALSKK